jgi:hypothetical protein
LCNIFSAFGIVLKSFSIVVVVACGIDIVCWTKAAAIVALVSGADFDIFVSGVNVVAVGLSAVGSGWCCDVGGGGVAVAVVAEKSVVVKCAAAVVVVGAAIFTAVVTGFTDVVFVAFDVDAAWFAVFNAVDEGLDFVVVVVVFVEFVNVVVCNLIGIETVEIFVGFDATCDACVAVDLYDKDLVVIGATVLGNLTGAISAIVRAAAGVFIGLFGATV